MVIEETRLTAARNRIQRTSPTAMSVHEFTTHLSQMPHVKDVHYIGERHAKLYRETGIAENKFGEYGAPIKIKLRRGITLNQVNAIAKEVGLHSVELPARAPFNAFAPAEPLKGKKELHVIPRGSFDWKIVLRRAHHLSGLRNPQFVLMHDSISGTRFEDLSSDHQKKIIAFFKKLGE